MNVLSFNISRNERPRGMGTNPELIPSLPVQENIKLCPTARSASASNPDHSVCQFQSLDSR